MSQAARVLYLTSDPARFQQVAGHLPAGQYLVTRGASVKNLGRQKADLLLCDLPLPDRPGLQTLDELQLNCAIPVILLGGQEDAPLEPVIRKREAAFAVHNPAGLANLPALADETLQRAHQTQNFTFTTSQPSQLILDNMADSIWLFDLGLRPIYMNPAALKSRGYSLEEMRSLSLAEQLSGPSLERLRAVLAEALSPRRLAPLDPNKDRPNITIEVELTRKLNLPTWMDISLTLLRGEDGIPSGILVIGRDISARKETEKLQNAVWQIAQLTYSAQNLPDLYRSIHQILGTVMRADNFYIALHDTAKNLVEFPYFVDEFDPPPPPHPFARGLTEYVIRTGEPLLAKPQLFEHLKAIKEVISHGAGSFDWLGVPLKAGGRTIGMMAVQTYSEGKRYNEHDLDILTFVSNQVATVVERKRIEEVSNRYASIVNSAGELMTLIDRSYTYVAVNDAYCQRTNIARENVIGKNVLDIWGENSFKRVIKQSLDQCLSGQEVHNEDWFDFNGLNYGYYKVSYYPYRDEHGEITHAIVITHEITSHKLSELALQRRLEMEQLAASITSRLINLPAHRLDSQIESALAALGEFLHVDRSFLNWFDESLEAVERRLEWCAPGISPRNVRFLKQVLNKSPNRLRALREGQTLNVNLRENNDPEWERLRQEGLHYVLMIPIMESETLFGTLGFDILGEECAWRPEDIELLKVIAQSFASAQHRQRSEQALARERNLLRTLIDNMPDMVYLKDRQSRYQVINTALRQSLGAEAQQDVIGKDDRDFFPAAQAEGFVADDRSVLDGSPIINREVSTPDPQGRERWLMITKLPFYNDEGVVEGLVGIGRNITGRKRAEEAMRHRLAFETEVAVISARFINTSAAQIDDEIRRALESLGQLSQVDRCYLFWLNGRQDAIRQSIEWKKDPSAPFMPVTTRIKIHPKAWFLQNLRQGEVLHVPHMADLPPEAEQEAKIWDQLGIRSLIAIPILSGKTLLGLLGFHTEQEERSWSPEDIQMLRLVSEILGNAVQHKRSEETLARRNAILEAINFAAGKFLSPAPVKESIQEVIQRFGEATHVSRVYLFKNLPPSEDKTFATQTYEWTAKGIIPQINNSALTLFCYEEAGFTRWRDLLGQGEILHGDIAAFPQGEQNLLDAQGIRSILVVPIFVNQRWWGFMGFDDCWDAEREWLDEERDALQTAAALVGTALQRQQIVDELRESEQRFRAVFESAGIGILLVSPEGRILQSNPSLQKMLDYNPNELMKLTLKDIIHPEDYPREERRLRIVRSQRQSTSQSTEQRYLRKDGSIVWGLLSATTINDEEGNSIYGLGMVQDITPRKQSEAIIRETQEQLAERVRDLEENARQISLLTELSNMLQLSSNVQEVYGGITRYGSLLFPNTDGALFILSENQQDLRMETAWGNPSVSENPLMREDCWAIRRVRPYLVSDAPRGLLCRHIGADRPASSICLPVTIQSQVVGLLNIQGRSVENPLNTGHQQFAAALAEQIGLTLSNIQLRSSMNRMMIQDPLTGLYNRLYMEEALERELQRAAILVSVVKFDLDNLTHINSTYGFTRGDTLLRELGKLLKNLLRPIDIACRTGGDEFILILPDVGLDYAMQKVNELRTHLANFSLPDAEVTTLHLTISGGLAAWPLHARSSSALILAAENALQRAKQNGGDAIEVAQE